MSHSLGRKTYSTSSAQSSSPVLEECKKRTSLLKDNSWIRRDPEEDEPVDRDPNPGRAVLSRYRSNETLSSPVPAETRSPKTASSLASVQSLSKRFSASQDELSKSSTLPSYGRSTAYSTKSTSSLKFTDEPKPSTATKTVKEEPRMSTTTTTVTKDGKTTETTTITTSTARDKTPTKTETFTERVFSDVKSSIRGRTSSPPGKADGSETTDVKVTTSKTTDDQLFDTLIPTSITTDYLTPESPKTVSKTETVAVKTSMDSPHGDITKTTTRTSSTTEDQLFDSLLPSALKSGSSPPDSTSTTIITKREIVTVDSSKGTEDQLYDSLLPSALKSGSSPPDSTSTTTITKREIVTVDSAKGDNTKTVTITSPTSPTKTSFSRTEDQLYDSLLPSALKSGSSSPDSTSTTTITKREIVTVDSAKGDNTKTVTITSPTSPSKTSTSYEYSRVSSPPAYNLDSSRLTNQLLSDSLTSRSSSSVYSAPERYSSVCSAPERSRTVREKDLCSYCRKSMSSDPKMVLDDMNINCHATCFKCQVCNTALGDLKAGDSLWVYRRSVHCESCFDVTREKWRR